MATGSHLRQRQEVSPFGGLPDWQGTRVNQLPWRVDSGRLEDALRRLVDDYRAQCLWFLREDYYPDSPASHERVLALIERHGDLQAFGRVAEVRTWLSRISSDASAAS